MKKFLLWIAGILGVLLVGVAVLVATGQGGQLALTAASVFLGPSGDFDPADAATAPDYSKEIYWAALPGKADPADWLPAGVAPGAVAGEAPADVFFVHPTGFLTGSSWTSSLDLDSAAEENTSWMMAHQAGAFNGCCNVYAPRYREASIFTYFAGPEKQQAVLGFAYADVVRAFEYYLEHYNRGRPFILASHSQGTHHGVPLLREHIAGSGVADRLVAAYLIGGVMDAVTMADLESLAGIHACEHATDSGCVVAWDTYGDGGEIDRSDLGALCTNPLNWRADEELAPASMNLGAVVPAWPFKASFTDDGPTGLVADALPAPLPGHTWAQCRNGTLFVADQAVGPFATSVAAGGQQSLHLLDYNLFYMNIRANAVDRVDAWKRRNSM